MNLKYNKENCGLLLEESSNFRTFMVVNIARSTVIFPIYKAKVINPPFLMYCIKHDHCHNVLQKKKKCLKRYINILNLIQK